MEIVSTIIQYEEGNLDIDETLKLFSILIKTGMIYHLQGHYQRVAMDFIQNGFLSQEGDLL